MIPEAFDIVNHDLLLNKRIQYQCTVAKNFCRLTEKQSFGSNNIFGYTLFSTKMKDRY